MSSEAMTVMEVEIVIATILSFRSKSKLSKQEIKQEIVRKARYALKRAAVAT